MTDSERIDWLESQCGSSLICDDNGRWAVAVSGWQNLQDGDGVFITERAIDIQTTFCIDADEWKDSIREAIDCCVEKEDDEV